MRRNILFFMLILFSLNMIGCQKTYQKDIDEIYFYHSAFGQRYPEFKIDLKNKKFWKYTSESGSDYVERDASSENEGYTFVCDLSDEKIGDFLRESARYGLTSWKESYVEENIQDGHQWGMNITFFDSTNLMVYGSNKYPETWDEMYDTFMNLTGEDIFLMKSNWLSE